MKESKFIELLNLYIDQQISPEDVASLEEEILQNPRRRQIYGQYCRMHRACIMALDRYHAPNETEQSPGGRVVAFEAPRRTRWGYYAAGLAAAACVTLVAVQAIVRSGGGASSHAVAAVPHAPALAKSVPAAAVIPVRMDVPGARALPRPEGYIAQRLRFTAPVTGTPSGLFLAGSDPNNTRISVPMLPASTLRVTPRPSIEDFVFTHDPATPENPKIFRSRQPGDEQEENVAIEFQRQ